MTQDNTLYQRVSLTKYYMGRSEVEVTDPLISPYTETGLGLKYRIPLLAAVIVYNEFHIFKERIQNRLKLLNKLSEGLKKSKGIQSPSIRNDVTMGSFFGYKQSYVPGKLYLDGKKLDKVLEILHSSCVETVRSFVFTHYFSQSQAASEIKAKVNYLF